MKKICEYEVGDKVLPVSYEKPYKVCYKGEYWVLLKADTGDELALQEHENVNPYESNIEVCEVRKTDGGSNFIYRRDSGLDWPITEALNDTDFIGYKYKSGIVGEMPRMNIDDDQVAAIPVAVLFKKGE